MERSTLFETLKERGYVYQLTNEEEVKKLVNGEPMAVYLGIDPTADSLHIGHFFALMMIKYFQDAGHKAIVLVGGATAMIGDPTGKSDLRKMISKETVEHNLLEIKEIIKKFVDVDGDNPAVIVNNADWIRGYDYIDFMRDVGIHFNVNKMLSCDAYANRLESGGLTFLEMGYMLMQAYDFVHLNREFDCRLQIGGSDQWANILAGADLGRKLNLIEGKDAEAFQGLTCPLLTNHEGKKMGKTEKGTLWVAREKTSVFDFYQYFYNVDDKDVETLLKLFTRLPLQQIKEVLDNDIRKAKQLMAFEITKLVHGQQEAVTAMKTAESMFFNQDMSNAPSVSVDKKLIEKGMPLPDLCVHAGVCETKSEVRRLVQQGGICVNASKIADFNININLSDFKDGNLILKKGKKTFIKVVLQ